MRPHRPPEEEDSLHLKIKTDALRLLSFRPRSVSELRSRLKLKRYPLEAVDEILDLLTRQGLLDDEKFAKLYTESRIYSRPAGKKQIEADLRKKGLSRDLIRKTLGSVPDTDEADRARSVAHSRFLRMAGLPKEKKKQRLFGFLKRRGFQTDVIFTVINGFFKDGTDTDSP